MGHIFFNCIVMSLQQSVGTINGVGIQHGGSISFGSGWNVPAGPASPCRQDAPSTSDMMNLLVLVAKDKEYNPIMKKSTSIMLLRAKECDSQSPKDSRCSRESPTTILASTLCVLILWALPYCSTSPIYWKSSKSHTSPWLELVAVLRKICPRFSSSPER